MTYLFSCFVFYSFIGFILEVLYSRATKAKKLDRKCFFLFPLCPVYGFGAIALLSLPVWLMERPVLFFFAGGITATVVEYLIAVAYEQGVGVKFWDYSAFPGNLSGRVCLLFTFFWSLLACALVYGLHPLVSPYLLQIPLIPLQFLFLFLSVDALLTLYLLHKSKTTEVLRWYAAPPQMTT